MKVDVLAGFLVEGRCAWVGGVFEFNVRFVFGRGDATLSGPVGPRAQSAQFGGRSNSSDLGAAQVFNLQRLSNSELHIVSP